MVGTGRQALDHTVQEPGEADAHGTADTAQRDALAQQVCNQGALLVRNATVFGSGHKLALARFTLMILFAMVGMAIFFLPIRSTLPARRSCDHGGCLPPSGWV